MMHKLVPEIKTLLSGGLPQKEIAIKLERSQSLISVLIKKYSLKQNKKEKHIGEIYGQLTILKFDSYDKNGHISFECSCDCGQIIKVKLYQLQTGNNKSCGCNTYKKGKSHASYKGYEGINSVYFTSLKRGAVSRNLDFDIDIKYIWDLYIEQNKRCALSMVPIFFPASHRQKYLKTASLDRIDSSKGYIKGNVQWVHKDVNFMKQDFSQNDFIMWCSLIYKHNHIKHDSDFVNRATSQIVDKVKDQSYILEKNNWYKNWKKRNNKI